MLSIEIPKYLERKVNKLAKKQRTTFDAIIIKALEYYITLEEDELIFEIQDWDLLSDEALRSFENSLEY